MAELTITGAAGRKITLPTGLFIDNTFTPAEANKTVTIENPTTASPIGSVSAAQTSDVDRAVLSARKASATWKNTPPQERRRLLNKLADLIERDVEEFASIEAVDAGMLYNMSMGMSVPQAAETCRYFAGWADKLDGQSLDYESGLAYTKREPIGVCAAVVPWNTPLAAKSNLKRVTLELGGKGPSIIFSDADWENALMWSSMGITTHNGQICAAGSRIYVQEDIYDKFVEEFSKRTKDAVMGDPLLQETVKGPVISSTQKERIMGFIAKANSEGTQVLHGGSQSHDSTGHFVPNTAYVNVSPSASIIREEVFGPVASIAKFKTEQEVIDLANDNVYGLAASVFTNDISKAIRVSDKIECGLVCVNSWGSVNANTPFGGIKQSGFGRENGEDALHDWTQVKCFKVNVFKL
ncbi:Uncharacterized protein Y057_2594 [Fusarium fujikuroi]|nr:Uncharacterized protein Y057_2594 [Fusarium fujikuroi]